MAILVKHFFLGMEDLGDFSHQTIWNTIVKCLVQMIFLFNWVIFRFQPLILRGVFFHKKNILGKGFLNPGSQTATIFL